MEAGEARPKQESKPMTDPPEDLGGVRGANLWERGT